MGIKAAEWLQCNYKLDTSEINATIEELADKFIAAHNSALQNCLGSNKAYVIWFKKLLETLKPEELPYAFSDYFGPTNHWKTSLGNEIETIPGDDKYYF